MSFVRPLQTPYTNHKNTRKRWEAISFEKEMLRLHAELFHVKKREVEKNNVRIKKKKKYESDQS